MAFESFNRGIFRLFVDFFFVFPSFKCINLKYFKKKRTNYSSGSSLNLAEKKPFDVLVNFRNFFTVLKNYPAKSEIKGLSE